MAFHRPDERNRALNALGQSVDGSAGAVSTAYQQHLADVAAVEQTAKTESVAYVLESAQYAAEQYVAQSVTYASQQYVAQSAQYAAEQFAVQSAAAQRADEVILAGRAAAQQQAAAQQAAAQQAAAQQAAAQRAALVAAWERAAANHPAAPVTPPAPAPVVNSAPASGSTSVAGGSDATSTNTAHWACIRLHESGNRYNSPAAPSGAYGILGSTWHSFGYSGMPYQASAAVQDALALRLYNQLGWSPWSTRTICGL